VDEIELFIEGKVNKTNYNKKNYPSFEAVMDGISDDSDNELSTISAEEHKLDIINTMDNNHTDTIDGICGMDGIDCITNLNDITFDEN